jgi:hypothetical protein
VADYQAVGDFCQHTHGRADVASIAPPDHGPHMNFIEVNGTALRYEFSGAGANTLVLIHEMGGTLERRGQGRALPPPNATHSTGGRLVGSTGAR